MDNLDTQKIIEESEENILCTECGEIYEPASALSDIRCSNCGNHQNPNSQYRRGRNREAIF